VPGGDLIDPDPVTAAVVDAGADDVGPIGQMRVSESPTSYSASAGDCTCDRNTLMHSDALASVNHEYEGGSCDSRECKPLCHAL
jgi:hypothetical protein